MSRFNSSLPPRKPSARVNKGNRMAEILEKTNPPRPPSISVAVMEDISASFPPPLKEGSYISFDSTASTSSMAPESAVKPRIFGASPGKRKRRRKRSGFGKRKRTSQVKQELREGEFIVERILGYKMINKVRHAKVKWKGFRCVFICGNEKYS